MYKICCLVLFASIVAIVLSACSDTTSNSMIQSKRRLEKYIVPLEASQQGKKVDLSEGPKLKYNADLGPKSPSFDFKIVDPY